MPEPQPHERIGASRRSVDRAGDLLRDWHRSGSILLSPDEQEAERLIERFRHEFEVPLTKVVMGLGSFLASEGIAVEVGQRLKRRLRIVDARAVERLDARDGLALKDEHGPDPLLRYLERMAYALDITHRSEAMEQQLQEELAVLEREAGRWLSDQEPKR